ncbi:lipopolysaccharide biosynthesis protein [Actinomycetospora sp. CA-053990]|uniref:lipopolysaccharide biosynthesis protein n=1 Tax=Actinomycetospora sp. CA-053990 TaxID=3239891 RepID=UPI003D90F1AC
MPESTVSGRGPAAARMLVGRVGGVAGSLVAGQVLLGLTYVFAARAITPEALGIVATCFAISVVSATVFDLGLMTYLVRESAGGRLDVAAARAVHRSKRRVLLPLALVSAGAGVVIAPDLATGLVLGAVAPLVWEAQSANALLRAQERFAQAATAQLLGRLGGLIVVVVLLLAGVTELALPIGLASSFAIEAVVDRLFLGRPSAGRAPWGELARAQRWSVSFGLAALASIGQQLDTPFVALGGGPAAAGIYAGAGRLLGPLLFLSSALALVGLPWLARAGDDEAGLRVEERRIGRVTAGICLAPLLAAVVGPPLIPLILGAQYEASGGTFAVLAVGAAVSTVNQGLALVLQNRGHQGVVARAVAIGLALGLVSTYALAVVGGPVWAAAGFVVSQLWIVVHLGVRAHVVRRHPPAREPAGKARR